MNLSLMKDVLNGSDGPSKKKSESNENGLNAELKRHLDIRDHTYGMNVQNRL